MTAPVSPLRLVVLGASGATGRYVVEEALSRGHEVHAIVRDPARYDHQPRPRLTVHQGDVNDTSSVAGAITPESVVVSTLGVRTKKEAGVLTAGARAVLATSPARVVWLGAIGTGRSTNAVGSITHRLLKAGFGPEYDDKTTADNLILDAGHSVFHAGPLTGKTGRTYEALPVSQARRRFFPSFITREGAARLLVDEAEHPTRPGTVLIARPAP